MSLGELSSDDFFSPEVFHKVQMSLVKSSSDGFFSPEVFLKAFIAAATLQS